MTTRKLHIMEVSQRPPFCLIITQSQTQMNIGAAIATIHRYLACWWLTSQPPVSPGAFAPGLFKLPLIFCLLLLWPVSKLILKHSAQISSLASKLERYSLIASVDRLKLPWIHRTLIAVNPPAQNVLMKGAEIGPFPLNCRRFSI